MPRRPYQTSEDTPLTVNEPTVTYNRVPLREQRSENPQSLDDFRGSCIKCGTTGENKWNPNVPFHGTQEEWWEHFHQIEKGKFMTIEEADKEFEIWKVKFLASRM